MTAAAQTARRAADPGLYGRVVPAAVSAAVVVGVAATLAGLVATGSLERAAPGLPDPGALVRVGLPAARAVQDLAACLTVGLLVSAAFILPAGRGSREGMLGGVRLRAVRWAARSAFVWLGAGVVGLAFTCADVVGAPVTSAGFRDQLGFFVQHLDLGRSLVVSLVFVTVVATAATAATRVVTAGVLAVASLVALLPLALAGHAAGSDDHQLAVDSLGAHLLGVTVWVGALAALVLLAGRLGDRLGVAVSRYSSVAGWCYLLVAASGVINAWLRVGSFRHLASPYGALIVTKSVLLVALGAIGWWHRTRLIPRLREQGRARRTFVRLACGEVALMGLTVGVAVALSRSAPPIPQTAAGSGSALRARLGYDMPPPVSVGRMMTEGYIDILWLGIALAAVWWYLRAVWRLRSAGHRWSLGRAATWVAGWCVLVWATSGGPAVYGEVMFSAHMIQHMTIVMLVPPLLVLGSPVTLAFRTLPARRDGSMGPREWLQCLVHSRLLRVLAQPVVACVIFVGSMVAFYYSSLFTLALSTHTGHVLMCAHFLLSGYLFAWVFIGTDPGPPRPAAPLRMVLLLVTLSFHAFFGVALMSSNDLLAADWWPQIGETDVPSLIADQQLGGAIAWGTGDLPTLLLCGGLAFQWMRADEREARRHDRQADRDGDSELRAYNAWLAARAEATGAPPARP